MKDNERHISRQFDSELQGLSSAFLALGGAVERQVSEALNALMEADSKQAQQVRQHRSHIQQMREQIDEACLRILARRQPTASDLRLVISVCKAVIDLERIGEEAGKIAKRAIALAEEGAAPRGYIEVRHIGGQVTQMVRDVLPYLRLEPDVRATKIREWNQPVIWPIGLVLALLALVGGWAWRAARKRERQIGVVPDATAQETAP